MGDDHARLAASTVEVKKMLSGLISKLKSDRGRGTQETS
jgi:hypothetical protein